MRDPLAIVRDEYYISIAAAMILGVVLLLSASLGFGGTIVQNALGQFNIPPLPGENTAPSPPPGATTTTTTAPSSPQQQPSLPQGTTNGLTFLDRGLMGTTLHTQGGDGSGGAAAAAAAGNKSTFVVAGIFRIYSNESLVQRFVAEMNLAAIDGTAFHNVTIEETSPHRFKLTETANGNASTTTTANNASTGGSIPPVSSQLKTRIFVDGNTPVVDNVPMTISIRGQVLAIQGISIDASTVTDPTVRNVLSIINGHSLYGTVLR
jgi:hypothetical protein